MTDLSSMLRVKSEIFRLFASRSRKIVFTNETKNSSVARMCNTFGMPEEISNRSKLSLATEAAELYYVQGRKMETIGGYLNLSRSSVSRLLQMARDLGIIEFRIHSPSDLVQRLESEIHAKFGVTANVIPCPPEATSGERLDVVGQATAAKLGKFFRPGMTIGIAWGSTISAVSRHIHSVANTSSRIVQLNGAGNDHSSGLTYAGEILNQFAKSIGGLVVSFPVPAFFDNPETKQAMWQERSTSRVLEIQSRIDLAIFGLGRIDAEVPSQVYAAGYLDSKDLDDLRHQNVSGDIATVFYRPDGSTEGIPLNLRSSGPSLVQLRKAPIRICVVSGRSKKAALEGALAGGYITDLYLDIQLAESLLENSSV